jgi:hypothetical protein
MPALRCQAQYAQCDGGICFKSTQGQSFPGFDEPLAKDEIICSCPITQQNPADPVGYQIAGPYPCQQSFFQNCSSALANNNTGSTLFVGAPTGTFDLLSQILTGSVPREQVLPDAGALRNVFLSQSTALPSRK